LKWPGLPRPTACAYRFSQPPGAFIRPEPAGLVSCQIRSWGFALQSIAPPAQPYAVSGAATLMTLRRPAAASQPALANRRNGPPSPASGKPAKRPSPSGFCSTRESATRPRRVRPVGARSSPGLFRPPGCFPSLAWTGFHRASPHGLGTSGAEASECAALQGLGASKIGSSLSRPPTLLGFDAS
jgi:hypothetical protein